jgi:hypothetical protein
MKISGPINYIVLEGKVNNSYKTIEIFFDIHIKTENCSKYTLMDYFNKRDDTLDIYIEDFFQDKTVEAYDNKFINAIRKELRSKIKYKHRIHNIDIRKLLSLDNQSINGIATTLYNYNKLDLEYSLDYLNTIYDSALIIESNIIILSNMIYLGQSGEYQYEATYKIITKLKSSYINNIVKNYITTELLRLKPYFLKIFGIIKKIKNEIDKQTEIFTIQDTALYLYNDKYHYFTFIKAKIINDYRVELNTLISSIYSLNRYINITLMDLYLARRILDKKYNANSIVYCGADHCITLIMMLVNKFNFSVIKTYYSTFNIENTNKIIKEGVYQQLKKILFPPTLKQCIQIMDN